MTQKTGTIKQAWQSAGARKTVWAVSIFVFLMVVGLGSAIRFQEEKQRYNILLNTAHTLASTALSGGEDAEDILLKVNDLLNIDAVLGVRLQKGKDIPLSVGETKADFPLGGSKESVITAWDSQNDTFDSALRLPLRLPYSWIVLRLNAATLVSPPHIGTLINWVGAPVMAFLAGLLCLWMLARNQMAPLLRLQKYLSDHAGKFASSPVPQELTKDENDFALIAKQIETLRTEIVDSKTKSDFQARFLHETPYPLLRCSVNRKVLYANVAARSEKALFGDDSKEFVAPALSELVRKAFYETKEVFSKIRCGNHVVTFRAIPVLDAGYVNLYGEQKMEREENE